MLPELSSKGSQTVDVSGRTSTVTLALSVPPPFEMV
jgi:hypothetical protein